MRRCLQAPSPGQHAIYMPLSVTSIEKAIGAISGISHKRTWGHSFGIALAIADIKDRHYSIFLAAIAAGVSMSANVIGAKRGRRPARLNKPNTSSTSPHDDAADHAGMAAVHRERRHRPRRQSLPRGAFSRFQLPRR